MKATSNRATCSIEGCDRLVVGRTLCDRHYRQARTGRIPLPPIKTRTPKTCEIDDCKKRACSRGLCGMHARRRDVNGDPLKARRYVKGGGKRITPSTGYIEVWNPSHPLASSTGYVLEHRMIAWDAGLFDDPSLHVHHLNHRRADNRLENLKPMTQAEHMAHHYAPGTPVRNQYGTWVVGEKKRSESAKDAA